MGLPGFVLDTISVTCTLRSMDLNTLRTAVTDGQSYEYLLFYGHTPSADGRVGSQCLSQWYGAGFELEGVYYATAEHRMMAGKAEVFGDAEMRERIIAASGPAEAKQLGRQVRNFDDRTWKARRFEIVVEASIAKFGQNAPLGEFLLGTEDKVLVEASPRDRIWGIGMGRNNPDATNPLLWRGQNLLGFALMKARDVLRERAGT